MRISSNLAAIYIGAGIVRPIGLSLDCPWAERFERSGFAVNEERFTMGAISTKGFKSFVEATRIITDTETGVQYLFAYTGEAGGLTLLVDRDGKPLLDKEIAEKKYGNAVVDLTGDSRQNRRP